MLLPPQHDDVMPPDGKAQLTLEDIMTLIDWIRNGAVFELAPPPALRRWWALNQHPADRTAAATDGTLLRLVFVVAHAVARPCA